MTGASTSSPSCGWLREAGFRHRRLRLQALAVCRHGRIQGGRPMSTRIGMRPRYDRISAPQQRWAAEQLDRLAPDRRRGGARRRLRLGQDHRWSWRGACRAARVYARRRRPVDGPPRPGGSRRPRHRALPGPGRAGATRARRRRVLQRHLSLDPDHDALFAALHRNMKPGARLRGPVRRPRQHRRFRRLADEVATEEPFAAVFRGLGQRPWNYATAEETARPADRCRLRRRVTAGWRIADRA